MVAAHVIARCLVAVPAAHIAGRCSVGAVARYLVDIALAARFVAVALDFVVVHCSDHLAVAAHCSAVVDYRSKTGHCSVDWPIGFAEPLIVCLYQRWSYLRGSEAASLSLASCPHHLPTPSNWEVVSPYNILATQSEGFCRSSLSAVSLRERSQVGIGLASLVLMYIDASCKAVGKLRCHDGNFLECCR